MIKTRKIKYYYAIDKVSKTSHLGQNRVNTVLNNFI